MSCGPQRQNVARRGLAESREARTSACSKRCPVVPLHYRALRSRRASCRFSLFIPIDAAAVSMYKAGVIDGAQLQPSQ